MKQDQHNQAASIGATDFMTPEQRRREIAQILATIGLRILNSEQAQETEHNPKNSL